MKALVVVAHPDDETIWMGGTLLAHPNWDWSIVSLCRKNDEDRMPKFKRVCRHYNAKAIIGDLDDEKLEPLSTKEVSDKILSLVPGTSYDCLFTHGKNGEYGHLRHKEAYQAIKSLVDNKILKAKKVFFFSYMPSNITAPAYPELKLALPNEKADMVIKLTKKQHNKKIELITQHYGFQHDSFEAWSCNKAEAFTYV